MLAVISSTSPSVDRRREREKNRYYVDRNESPLDSRSTSLLLQSQLGTQVITTAARSDMVGGSSALSSHVRPRSVIGLKPWSETTGVRCPHDPQPLHGANKHFPRDISNKHPVTIPVFVCHLVFTRVF